MPFYKLICRSCGTAFEKQASISDRTEERILCPVYASKQLDPDYTAGCASVQIKSTYPSDEACPHSGGCGCGNCCGGGR